MILKKGDIVELPSLTLLILLSVRLELQLIPCLVTSKIVQVQSKDASKGSYQHRVRNKGSSFATTVTSGDGKAHKKQDGSSLDKMVCLYCKGEHTLELCSLLEKRAHNEKIAFLKENGVCFGCLCIGHMSKDCRRRFVL